MNLTLDNFFKLENANIPSITLINAKEECIAAIACCTDFLKHQISGASSSPDHNLNSQIATHKFDIDRYFDFETVFDIINSQSLFDEINYIELNYKNKPTKEHQDALIQLNKNISTSNKLVITCDLLNKREIGSKWVQEIEALGGIILTLNENSIMPLVKYILQQGNLSIDSDALQYLINQNESNTTQLLQELNNLVFYYPGGTKLTCENIQNIINNNAKYNIYQLSNAYLAGNLKNCMLILDNIYNKTEDAILINWILNEDIRKLLKLKSKLKTNNNINQCIREIGVWGDSVHKLPIANKRLNYKTLTEILKMISTLDLIIKGVLKGDPKDQIIQIIIKLTG